MLRPLPNHGTLRLPNDDDDDDVLAAPSHWQIMNTMSIIGVATSKRNVDPAEVSIVVSLAVKFKRKNNSSKNVNLIFLMY